MIKIWPLDNQHVFTTIAALPDYVILICNLSTSFQQLKSTEKQVSPNNRGENIQLGLTHLMTAFLSDGHSSPNCSCKSRNPYSSFRDSPKSALNDSTETLLYCSRLNLPLPFQMVDTVQVVLNVRPQLSPKSLWRSNTVGELCPISRPFLLTVNQLQLLS